MRTGNRRNARRRGRPPGRGGQGCLSRILLVAFFAAAIGATSVIFFKITRIDVVGNSKYTVDIIKDATNVSLGDNLLALNKYTVIRHITDKLPYIDEVRVSKGLPDTLIISVTECVPVAYIAEADGYWLIDKSGKLLEKASKLPESKLISVNAAALHAPEAGKTAGFGEEETGKQNTLSELLLALYEAEMLEGTNEIDIRQTFSIKFKYMELYTVELGILERLDFKLNFLKETLETLTDNMPGTIDLSKLIDTQVARFIPK